MPDFAHFWTIRCRLMGADGPADSMLVHLGAAARDARKRAGRKQIHLAYALDVSEGTVRRFERGQQWPRNPDATIRAYAEDLGIDPIDIWAEALRRWREAQP